ncbi:hypothetical protein BH23GEM9_BH23GEM9_01900 [soil metagenome]
MWRTCFLVIVLLACGSSGGDGPVNPNPPPPPPPPPATQQGVVQGSVTTEAGAGIAGVGIQLTRQGATARNTTTNVTGSYTFNAVDVGAWNLQATPPSGFEGVGVLVATVQVAANQTVTVPVLRMRAIAPPDPGQATVVTMGDNTFNPTPVTVPVGRVVRWVNGGTQAHNTTSSTGIWASTSLSPGGTFERTFATAGTFQYSCTLHDGMTGTVVVQ